MDLGSSPLSRGIPNSGSKRRPRVGIIPALAGNTRPHGLRQVPTADHPRSRGEYAVIHTLIASHNGSSPLSRGILNRRRYLIGYLRIIPALAGNTAVTVLLFRHNKDHPRSRGEYEVTWKNPAFASGSSPLSRGIPGAIPSSGRPVRIIPALAGNTAMPQGTALVGADHPRSRGNRPLGIIPALAGNTPNSLPYGHP